MSYDNYQLFTMTYPTKEAAMDGFDAVEYAFDELANVDTYDAAVVVSNDVEAAAAVETAPTPKPSPPLAKTPPLT